ncbi:hypothetical protein [Acinetobacter baumannii]|uniref:hypothetical protein n=1 Tax=Acinetobacter baumannii TaxID=470 RepID=UPI0019CF9DFA|nr:hypothetical protein [Acinetobacter baumannii]HDZ1844696.1 hypothetical protein [Acinetobacter baumannii]
MKPEQFIREYGVEKAREVVEGAPDGHKGYNGVINQYTRGVWFSRDVMLSDLKRLVESVELISLFGSIKIAKDKVKMADFNGFLLVSVPIENGLADVYIHKVEQAIRDHESIYGEEQ